MTTASIHASDPGTEPAWIGEVLHFWFDEVGKAHWFVRSDAIDAQIRDRFVALHERIASRADRGAATQRSLLAAVIVLDQFSRNLFRGTARAYAADPVARRLSRTAIERGLDAAMR
jgi:uncharacterized protein (DUF924 family)